MVENTPIVEASNTIAADSTPVQEPIAEPFVEDKEPNPEEEPHKPVLVDMEPAPPPACVDELVEDQEPPQTTEPPVEPEPSQPFTPSEPASGSEPPSVEPEPPAEVPSIEPESPVESAPPIEIPQDDPAPVFDVAYWVSFAQDYAQSVGLRLESSAVDCWDNPITAGPYSQVLERDIQSRLDRYAREDVTDVWIWAEPIGGSQYNIYIGYA